MRLNSKLLLAALFMGALALAGCGGGSDDTPEPAPAPAPEPCPDGQARNNDGDCVQTATDAAAAAAAAAKAAAAQKDAATLQGVLDGLKTTASGDGATAVYAYFLADTPADLKSKDAYKEMFVSVMGKAFNKEYTTNFSDGVLSITGEALTNNAKAKATAFGTSGTKTHTKVTLTGVFTTKGSYHGVDGTFTCSGGDACTSTITATGVTLAGTWKFKPDNPSAKVSDGKVTKYGWWTNDLGKSTTVQKAQVFYRSVAGDSNQVSDFAGSGTATYEGDAVGQYAIHRGAGAANDSGAFTADATLNVNFNDDKVTGMIDNFMGADGKARDWTVALQEDGFSSNDSNTWDGAKTVWTMGGVKGAAAGDWRGNLNGGNSTTTPIAAVGAFQAEHGNIGNMIGAFGASVK